MINMKDIKEWNERNVWVCDIEEDKNESDNDFLFLGDINGDGVATDNSESWGRCIFQNVMYDINRFIPDNTYDGSLDFELMFGRNTKQRTDAPKGWVVQFKKLKINPEDGNYVGKIYTSWWGDKPVQLIPYSRLNEEQKRKYPDLKAQYFKSLP